MKSTLPFRVENASVPGYSWEGGEWGLVPPGIAEEEIGAADAAVLGGLGGPSGSPRM